MAVLPLRKLGDPVLRTPAAPVGPLDARIADLVADMYETMDAAGGIGLAAPQIGVGLRIFTYDAAGSRGAVINPELTREGTVGPAPRDAEHPAEEENLLREGCLSVDGVYSPVDRAQRVVLHGTAPDGSALRVEADGLLAACFQHEQDHLDGRLFIDRLTGDDRRQAMRTLREASAPAPPMTAGPGPGAGSGAGAGAGSSFFAASRTPQRP